MPRHVLGEQAAWASDLEGVPSAQVGVASFAPHQDVDIAYGSVNEHAGRRDAGIPPSAGVPEGVITPVPTTDAADVATARLDDPRVRKLSFTGSTAVGRMLIAQAAARVVNTSMELGGNASFGHKPGDPVRVAERELDGRDRAGGVGHHDDPVDA
jgi:hypothetical protein